MNKINKEMEEQLINQAINALNNSYSPYSNFQVGAALLDENYKIWTGCNIESVSYSPTICAERTALSKAVSEGVKKFIAIAIVSRQNGNNNITEEIASPCGVCRQFLSEFCDDDFLFILPKNNGEIIKITMKDILPLRFNQDNLNSK